MASSHPQRNKLDAWRDFITCYYPDALIKTYCVPPLHLNRVPYKKVTIPDTGINALLVQDLSKFQQDASKSDNSKASPRSASPEQSPAQAPFIPVSPEATPVRVQESDFHDDFGQNHVVTNLQIRGEKLHEPMFILSQLSFGDYLQKPAYAAAAVQLPRPSDLDDAQIKYSDGEADIIVIHRRYGILIGELKSVGRFHCVKKTSLEDNSVETRIKKAVNQLSRSRKVIQHLVSDLAPNLTIKSTLLLPYVGTEQLRRVLESRTKLLKDVCQCLGAVDLTEAVELCVCADQLSAPDTYWDVNDDVLSKLSTWWRHRMAADDPLLCGPGGDELYLNIAARFVGPASTVSVHCPVPPRVEVQVQTAGQAVAELGWRLSRLVLTPQQLDLLTREPPIVYIHGPPGTGKTVLLVLQAVRWLLQGHDVHIISTRFYTLAVSRMIQKSLGETMATTPQQSSKIGTVHVHDIGLSQDAGVVDKTIKDLSSKYRDVTLCVIMDEVSFGQSNKADQAIRELVDGLCSLQADGIVKQIRLWCAGAGNEDLPDFLPLEKMITPLRSAPSVIREVKSVLKIFFIPDYNDLSLPAPGDGPAPIRLLHSGEGHSGPWPVDCEACGRIVAETLIHLRLSPGESSALSWRDVFVLTRRSKLYDDHEGKALVPCHFVQGLRGAGIPVGILCYKDLAPAEWSERVADVATASTDQVTVAHFTCVRGLERRVVVWLESTWEPEFDKYSRQDAQDQDYLYIFSRCTTQLVAVTVPQQCGGDAEQPAIWTHGRPADRTDS